MDDSWWEETRRDQLCFDPISRVGSDCFPFGFQHTLSSHVTFYHNSQHFLQRTILKQFHRSNKINTSSAPFVDTSKTLLLYDNASVDKAKVAVTFLKPPPPTAPTWLHVTFDCPPPIKVGWSEIFQLPGPRNSNKVRAPRIVPIRLPKCLWNLEQTPGIVCAKLTRVLWRTVSVVVKWNRYCQLYSPADITEWTARENVLSDPVVGHRKLSGQWFHNNGGLYSALTTIRTRRFTIAVVCVWLFPRVWGFRENVRQFIPRLRFKKKKKITVEISARKLIALFRPRSVQSG